jgi:hypothetical protein
MAPGQFFAKRKANGTTYKTRNADIKLKIPPPSQGGRTVATQNKLSMISEKNHEHEMRFSQDSSSLDS